MNIKLDKNPVFNLKEEAIRITNLFYPGTYKEDVMSESKAEDYEGEEQRLKREGLLAMKNQFLYTIIDWGADDDQLELFKKIMVDFIIDYEIPTE